MNLPGRVLVLFMAVWFAVAEQSVVTRSNQLGQFFPSTAAEHELEKMLRGKDEDIDLGLANWLIAADIPQLAEVKREAYLAELETMTGQIRQEIAKMQKVAISRGQNPGDPDTKCAIFCNAIVRLRFKYAEEFREENLTPAQMKALYANPNNIFFVGLLRTRSGTCVSLPMAYLVFGQRLGFPVNLVTLGRHSFVRWEQPGYRMNIETTVVDKVTVTPDDSVFLDTEGIKKSDLKGNQLRNLSRREVLGNLFYARSGYWAGKGPDRATQQVLDLSRAHHLAPEDPVFTATHEAVFTKYGIRPEHTSIEIKPQPKK